MTSTYPLSNINQIEVLYGPVSAVYGPNAFLGVINIITKDSRKIAAGEDTVHTSVQYGSFDTQSVDIATRGNLGEVKYSVSAKISRSDGPSLDDYKANWGFISNELLSNRDIWGPILDQEYRNTPFGEYHNPSINWGVLGDITYKSLKVGLIAWDKQESDGVYYASDHVQPIPFWKKSGQQIYVEHEKQVRENLGVTTKLLFRESRFGGDWAEAEPDWNPGKENFSYVSISDWNTISYSWLFNQDFDFKFSETLQINGGIKYELKELSKSYDICGYWSGSFCSSAPTSVPGPENFGAGIFHSSSATFEYQADTLEDMPDSNLADTVDKGGYIQAIWDMEPFRYSFGVRYDDNSIYGHSINPRVSGIYHFSDKGTVKLLYGEAFQEPAPLQLWGGWSGRKANPDLKPEKARNAELILMYKTKHILHDLSLYYAMYDDVIKEDAENAGGRNIYGFEYRGRFQFNNFLSNSKDITGYFYYTHTKTKSSIHYDHANSAWVDGDTNLGDIAPHKINLGLNIPVWSHMNWNLKANYVSDRELYSRNPLRNQGEELGGYIAVDTNILLKYKPFTIAFKVKNIFDEAYYHPGGEHAESGNDFSKRAKGYRNSLIPQVGRNYMINFTMDY